MTSTRRRMPLWSGAAIAVALLAGCTPAPATPSSTPTSTMSASSEATPTATPDAAGADPAAWVIDFTGIGPLTIGGSLSGEVPATAPAYTQDMSGACPNPVTSILESDANPTIWLQTSAEGADDIALIAVGGDVPDEARAEGSPSTGEGIRIGSSLEESQAAYPAGQLEENLQGEPVRLVVEGTGESGDTRYLVFSLIGDAVQTILVQTDPELVPEFCG